jgi:hypothetical protein
MKPVGSWRSTSIRDLATGRVSVYGDMPATERTRRFGAFSFRQWRAVWIFFDCATPASTARKFGARFSPEPWRNAIKWASTPMTGSSRTRTPCQRVVLGTSLLFPCSGIPVNRGTVFFSIPNFGPIQTGGNFSKRFGGCRRLPPKHWSWRPGVRAAMKVKETFKFFSAADLRMSLESSRR